MRLGLYSRTQGQVAGYMAQFGPLRYRCWPSTAGQPMTNTVLRIFGVCANECQGPNWPWRMTFLVVALQWHCRMRGFLEVGARSHQNLNSPPLMLYFPYAFRSSIDRPARFTLNAFTPQSIFGHYLLLSEANSSLKFRILLFLSSG